uniref:XPGI domain-containing protein n=1 Tax=Heterorhabditis bacteriophora TaxID=37862 RepID=A0A1I7XH86_HETBA
MQKRHLEELATGSQSQTEIENVKKKLLSPSKRRRIEANIYEMPSVSDQKPSEVIELSDDDADIVVEKEVNVDTMRDVVVDTLIDERERIRVSRLRPSQIPTESHDFSKFQLQRLLNRSRLNKEIEQLSKKHIENAIGGKVKLYVSENKHRKHVFSYDSDQEVEIIEQDTIPHTISESSFELTLDHLKSNEKIQGSESNESTKEDTTEKLANHAEVSGREFLSKSGMIEELIKKRIGHEKSDAVVLHCDDWSSDSSEDDFIDVCDGPSFEISNYPQKYNMDREMEFEDDWEPQQNVCSSELNIKHPERKYESNSVDKEEYDGVYRELQDFLSACGIPWIEAPGEAEAQCVELETLGLVAGVISDDSDVWAFGVKNVYRHLFSKKKNVQHYEAKCIERETGLTQSDFISIAILSGSDYSIGLRGVGVVSAVELAAEFTQERRADQNAEEEVLSMLNRVEEWLLSVGTEKNETPQLTNNRRKLRLLIEKNNETTHIEGIANRDVVSAYMHPVVDNSREQFRWRVVNIDKIRKILYSQLGWEDERFDKLTLSPFQRWNDFITGKASYQRHITSYTHKLQQCSSEQKTKMTKRVQSALHKLADKKGNSLSPSLICQTSFFNEGNCDYMKTNSVQATAEPSVASCPKKAAHCSKSGLKKLTKVRSKNVASSRKKTIPGLKRDTRIKYSGTELHLSESSSDGELNL